VEVTNTMGASELVRKYLESDAGSDLLAEMVKMAAELLTDADVDLLCGAGYGERSENRVNSRNGHRSRRWDTRVGTINLEIPKLRRGSYLPCSSSRAAAPNRPWSAWSARLTSKGSRRGGWTTWCV
jgi:putative transposase